MLKDISSAFPKSYFSLGDTEEKRHAIELAKELLLVGPNNEDLVKKYLEILIDNGLPQVEEGKAKKILIVGAGITGLVAGSLLKQAGHEVTIIEANANRIGGRIKTFHKDKFNPNEESPFKDPNQYAEAGAMRLPNFHPLVLALIDKLNLKRRLFYNVSVDPNTGDTSGHTPPVTYTPFDGTDEWKYGQDNPNWKAPDKKNNTWIRTNNDQVRKKEYVPDNSETVKKINSGFQVNGPDLSKTTSDLLSEVLDPVRDRYSTLDPETGERVNKPLEEWIDGWASVIYDFDGYSMYGFLKKLATKKNGEKLTDNEIEAIGTIENLTSRLSLSFMHSFLGRADINPDVTYYEIEGGSWMLPYAILPELYNNIVMNRRMTHIEYYDPKPNPGFNFQFTSDKPGKHKVSVRTLSETETGSDGYQYEEEIFTADHCLITIPFSSLRHVSVSPMFSYKKRRAIIELHYDAATKVLLEFNQRWWEFKDEATWKTQLALVEKSIGTEQFKALEKLWKDRDPRANKDEILVSNYVGGGNVTDNPNRFMYVPSHPVPGSPGGVILASYSWSDDARRWDSMSHSDRYLAVLKGLVELHGWQAAMFYANRGQTQSWTQSPYAFGEAAVFTPGQMSSFHLDIPKREGPVHFAGEHVSLKHAWIEGCLETGTRAALEIHEAE